MNVIDAIVTRHSTRRYTDRIVEQEKLEIVLSAGLHGPTGGSSKNRHFLVIRERQVLEEMGRLVAETFAKMDLATQTNPSVRNSITKAQTGDYVFHYAPPVLIVLAAKKDYPNALADCACALENMMLAANALDLGSCWINQLHWLDADPAVREYLYGLGLQEDETVCGALSLGYADTENGLPARHEETPPESLITYIG